MATEEQVIRLAQQDEKVVEGLHEWLSLQELSQNAGWQYQRERFRNFKKGAMLAIARRLMAGVKIDPEQIAFERGFATGVEYVFDWPERIEKNLERAAEEAYLKAQEMLSEEDDERPYE